MLTDKTILITGAAGFIGSNLTEYLLKNNNFCILIDNFNEYYSGKEKQLKEILKDYDNKKDYTLIKADLLNKAIFNDLNNNIEIIFHLAAQAGVRYSIENAAEITNNNIVSTVNTFEYAKEKKIGKVVFASSSSVYGNPIYTPVDEKHPKNPISPYAVSKLCCEEYADYYYREYNLPITSLRFYTVFGPNGRPDMAIRKFFDLILKNVTIPIYGDGEQMRDFTYISNILDGLILAAENEKANGEVFNLGCSDPIKVNDLVDKMYEIANKQKKIKYTNKKKGDVNITYSDISKARKILGYTPKIHIDEGLQMTYQWQKNNT
jgi:nucleoside-diphosphate-sugar epimerase